MRRGRVLILLGLILAVVTAAVIFYILTSSQQSAAPEIVREDVVVAIQPIAEDEPVEGRVEIRPVAADSIPEAAIRSIEATAGMLAAGPIPQGTILQPDLLISPQERMKEGELGKLVEQGYVAVAFPVDELSSVSYGIQPGDHVDILMTLSFIDLDPELQIKEPLCPEICPGAAGEEEVIAIDPIGQYPRRVAQLTVQNAEVLGVGRWSYEPPPVEEQQETRAAQTEAPTEPAPPEYITLMLFPQDALVIKLAREYGASIDLAVRAQEDNQPFATEQVTLDYIMAHYGISLPAKQAYSLNNIDLVRPTTEEE